MSLGYQTAQQAIQAEAAEWILRLDEETLNLTARQELLAWLKSSPQHVDEFLLASAVWRELDDIDKEREADIDRLVAEAKENIVSLSSSNVTKIPAANAARTTHSSRRKAITWIAGVAASVVLGVFVGFGVQRDATQHYETGIGQQTLFTLDDGSIVHLNTQSSLQVRMTNEVRKLTLVRGEAMFEVARDPARPFRVSSGGVTVEAIGTQFNVYRRDDGVHVTVIEGEVKVESTAAVQSSVPTVTPVRLVAGEEAQSNSSGEVARIEAPDLEKHTAWREQRLVFRQDSLSAVAAEFNRYNRVQIVIDAPSDATRRITATFDAHDPESFVAFLERDPNLALTREDGTIRVTLANR